MSIYQEILQYKLQSKKLLAILLDPDKIVWDKINDLMDKINQSPATHIFVGGSLVLNDRIDDLILKIKQNCSLPILLFPGNPSQISGLADGILFLSLISGRNPDYLIEHQVNAVPLLKKTNLEIISTGYMLIDGGNETAVAKVSQTKPLDAKNSDYIVQTAQAGELLGNKMIYLEAGSGALNPIASEIIEKVSKNIQIPLIVGGGISDQATIQKAFDSGADMVVIGTAFENNLNFFDSQS
jgi:putative glycerol-1-phosphate prenyltransferase